MQVVLVDYGAGNRTSVELALRSLGADVLLSANPAEIMGAQRVVFPGVGAAGSAMESLQNLGLVSVLQDYAKSGKPFIGICLGSQIILEKSAENGGTDCLSILRGQTDAFVSTKQNPIKIPQIGWNEVTPTTSHPIFEGIPAGAEFYFVHSYYPVPAQSQDILAKTVYGSTSFASVIGRGNVVACQFHPEKSGRVGLKLLENFLKWDGLAAR